MIWLIDDDDIFKFVFSFQANKLNPDIQIQTYSSLEAGLAAFEAIEQAPQLLLVDINFPDKSGWDYVEQFIQAKERKNASTNIYMVSSSISKIDKDKTQQFPTIENILEKPIKDEELKNLLQTISISK